MAWRLNRLQASSLRASTTSVSNAYGNLVWMAQHLARRRELCLLEPVCK